MSGSAPAGAARSAVIAVTGLTKDSGAKRVVDHFDINVPRGAIYGFLGPNGSGKTTTVSILSTSLRPDAGHAPVDGLDVMTEAALVRRVIGLAGQFAASPKAFRRP